MSAKLHLPYEAIREGYLDGATVKGLAKKYDCDPTVIKKYLVRQQVPIRPRYRRDGQQIVGRPAYSSEQRENLVQRYQAGETIQALADVTGISFATMRDNLHAWGADIRRTGPERTYTLNETFFDVIDTEEKAYWLGFLLTDGSVSYSKVGQFRLRLELQQRDSGHIAKLLKALGSDFEIKPGAHSSVYAEFDSAHLCRALSTLECFPNKTCRHGTPILPEHLYRHFYRGATDGDGSILHIPQILAWRWEVTGSPRFIHDLQTWIVCNAGVSVTKLFDHGRAQTVRYTGGTQIERICRLLYEGATVYLDRKYAIYQQVLVRRREKGPKRKVA